MLPWLLLIYMVIYLMAAFVWRSLKVWRQTGINPYVLGSGDTPHDFIGKLFRLLIIGTLAVVGCNVVAADWLNDLVGFGWLQQPLFMVFGGYFCYYL